MNHISLSKFVVNKYFFLGFFVDSTWVSTNLYQRVYYKPLHADRKQERSVIQGGLNQAEISRKCNETFCGPLDGVSIKMLASLRTRGLLC